MQELAQQAINGLSIASVYALLAVSFTMVFGVLRVLNFAHGQLLMVGAFAAYLTYNEIGGGFVLGLVSSALAGALIGMLTELAVFRLLRKKRINHQLQELGGVVGTIGLATAILVTVQILTDGRTFSLPASYLGTDAIKEFVGLRIPTVQLFMLAVGLLSIFIVYLLLQRTRIGISIRAVADDGEMAEFLGARRNSLFLVVFAISGALAGITGLGIALTTQAINFHMGEAYLLKAFVIVVLGGLGDIRGAVLGALVLGMFEGLVGPHMSSLSRDFWEFVLLLLIILARPQGLLALRGSRMRGRRRKPVSEAST